MVCGGCPQDRSFAGLLSQRGDVLECLRLPTRARARADPGPRSASPSRVPGLPLAAGAAPTGCGYPGAERRGSAGRWSEVGWRGHRGLDIGKHLPTSAGGRPNGTKQVSQFPLPGFRGAYATAERQRDGPDDLPHPPPDSPALYALPWLCHPRSPCVPPAAWGECLSSLRGALRGMQWGGLRRRLPGCPFAESGTELLQMRPGSFAFHANEQIP